MEAWDVDAVAELVARRREFLQSVADGRTAKRALVEHHDVSRSTVDRAVRELEGRGFLERRNGEIRLTLLGRLALDAYDQFADALAGLDEAEPVLESLPADTPFCVDLLRGASVVASEPHAPHRPVSVLEELLSDTERVRTYSTMVVPELVERYRDVAVDGDCTMEVIACPTVVDVLVSDHSDALGQALDSGNVELYETTREGPQYSFLVADRGGGDWVGATLHGDRGITGVLTNDRREAVEWLHTRYEEIRADAERLS